MVEGEAKGAFFGSTCAKCARFRVPDSGCPWYADIKEGTIRSSDAACESFYPAARSKAKKKTVPPAHKASGFAEEGFYEAIYHGGKPAFLVKASDGFKILETVNNEGKETVPKDITEIPYEPYGFSGENVPSLEELFRRIRVEFNRFLDVEEVWKDFLASCVLLSYQQEKTTTVPYAYLVGDNESGKTVALTLLSKLCYRSLFGVSIPPADIYGYLDDSDVPGTILEDEAQGLWKDTDKAKIYKAGYKRGATTPRTFITQNKRFMKYFRVFCFKACAAEEIPRLKGLAERFILIHMVEGLPQKEWADVDSEDEKRFRELRNTLLKWRLQTAQQELPEIVLPVKGRLKELWKPILQITSGLPVYDRFFKFVEDQRKERLSAKQDTLEGKIVKVVTGLFSETDDGSKTIPFPTIWRRLQEELDGRIDDKKPNVMDTSEFFQVTKNKVGYRLREVVSGKSRDVRTEDTEGNEIVTKGYTFEQEKLRRIAKKYGYEFVVKLSSEAGPREIRTPESTEKEDGKDVETDLHTKEKLASLSYSATDGKEPSNQLNTDLSTEHLDSSEHEGIQCAAEVSLNSDKALKILEFVRSRFVEGTEEEWLSIAVEAGLSKEGAYSLFERLKGTELFWFDRTADRKTVWRWIRQ